jgi:hypothetical protein
VVAVFHSYLSRQHNILMCASCVHMESINNVVLLTSASPLRAHMYLGNFPIRVCTKEFDMRGLDLVKDDMYDETPNHRFLNTFVSPFHVSLFHFVPLTCVVLPFHFPLQHGSYFKPPETRWRWNSVGDT